MAAGQQKSAQNRHGAAEVDRPGGDPRHHLRKGGQHDPGNFLIGRGPGLELARRKIHPKDTDELRDAPGHIGDGQDRHEARGISYRDPCLLHEFASGRRTRRLTVEVDRAGLAVGQCQNIVHSRESISGDYLIVSASIRDRGDGDCRISYECVPGENVGSWPEFFRTPARAGVSFAIRENEILIVIREKKETVTFADSATAASGNSLTAWTSDPYTVGRVGTSEVGGDWTLPDGSKNAYGPRVGEVYSP